MQFEARTRATFQNLRSISSLRFLGEAAASRVDRSLPALADSMPSLHHGLRRRLFYAHDAAAAYEQGGWRRWRRRRPSIASAARLFARLDGDRRRRGGDHRADARLDTRRRDGARRARRLFGAHVDRSKERRALQTPAMLIESSLKLCAQQPSSRVRTVRHKSRRFDLLRPRQRSSSYKTGVVAQNLPNGARVSEWRERLIVAECIRAFSRLNQLRYIALSAVDQLERIASARYADRSALNFHFSVISFS